MRLIGAGLPRTSTLSQKTAMEQLGLTPCHHMVSVFADLPQARLWRRAAEGDLSAAEIVGDHPAAVDWPASYFYRELMEAFPDAVVLLSVRPGEAWAKSIRQTIWGMFYDDKLSRHMTAAREAIDPEWREWMETLRGWWTATGLFDGPESTDEQMIAGMERWNEEVKRTVPADRLLVWSPQDGWEPICNALGVPVPDEPFPRVHDSASFDVNIVKGAVQAVQAHIDAQG
ncbi:MAG: sulfotransferase family protein [Solirubrobacteraceae bacterium]